MAHPFAEHRQSKVEHSRVSHITKGYAAGGGVHSDAAQDRKMVKGMVKSSALTADGGAVKYRADRPARKRGGRVGKTNVNIIVGTPPNPQAGLGPMPAPIAAPIVPPPMAARPPIPVPPGPPGIGPAMPPRSSGGRTYKTGGGVKGTKVYEESKRLGTQVSHTPGKNDLAELNRPRVVTYAKGGKVESPNGIAKATDLPGGSGGGLARIAKAHRAARKG